MIRDAGEDHEAHRQQALAQALSSSPEPGTVAGLQVLCGPSRQAPTDAGLLAYRRNAMATAWRALVAAYPTLQQVLGDEALRALARDLWRRHPPQRGDLTWFGDELPAHLASLADYTAMSWLPDLARLDWAVHCAGFAADAAAEVDGLALLGEHDPQQLALAWSPGCCWMASPWPAAALWRAHQAADEPEAAQRWASANAALQDGQPEYLWVQRQGLAVVVQREDDAVSAAFNTSLWQGASLGAALDQALSGAPHWSFQNWLVGTLQAGRLAAVRLIPAV